MTPIIPGIVASSDGRQPGVPVIGTASAGDASATVTFTLPTYLGKPGDNNLYTATSSPGSITGTSATTSINITGLSNGTAYTFTVNAKTRTSTNVDISSSATSSSASNSVTPFVPYYNPYYNPPIYFNPPIYSNPPASCGGYNVYFIPNDPRCSGGTGVMICYGGPAYEFVGCTGT